MLERCRMCNEHKASEKSKRKPMKHQSQEALGGQITAGETACRNAVIDQNGVSIRKLTKKNVGYMEYTRIMNMYTEYVIEYLIPLSHVFLN